MRRTILPLVLLALSAGVLLHCAGEDRSAVEATSPETTARDESATGEEQSTEEPIVGRMSVTTVPLRNDPGFEVVRRYTAQFYAGEFEKLHDRFSDEMKQVVPLEKLEQIHAFVADQYGREIEVLSEDTQSKDDYRAFVRWTRFSDHDGVIQVQWILHEDDSVAGFFIEPAQPRSGS